MISLSAPNEQWLPLVVSVPHAGRELPEDIAVQLCVDSAVIARTEDRFMDWVAAAAIDGLGARSLVTELSRIAVDCNRAREDRDDRLLGHHPSPRHAMSFKANHGYGVVPRRALGAVELYPGPITEMEVERRLQLGWDPFHEALNTAIKATLQRFGRCLVVDCHSMPPLPGPNPAQVVLSDNNGAALSTSLLVTAAELIQAEGLSLAVNQPYAGGHITQHYGQHDGAVQVVQVEFCRSLYLHDDLINLRADWQLLSVTLRRLIETLTG